MKKCMLCFCIVVVLGYMLFYKYYVALILIRRLSSAFQQELHDYVKAVGQHDFSWTMAEVKSLTDEFLDSK